MKNRKRRIVEFEAGYDCIKFKCKWDSDRCIPGEGGSHGKHGLSIRFVLKGNEGAVQFLLYTGWYPQFKKEDEIGCRYIDNCGGSTLPADLGYHSKKPRREEQEPIEKECKYCDGMPCYYDGSGLNANDAMYALINGGDDALWDFLDKYYDSIFHDSPYPRPAEYCKELR